MALFEELKNLYDEEELGREKTILKSRQIVSLSKTIITALHRDNIKKAELNLKLIEKEISELTKFCKGTKQFYSGSYKIAFQEYVEALSYYKYIKNSTLPKFKNGMDVEYYLLGICDTSGELVRRALNKGIKGDFQEVKKIKDFVTEIYDSVIEFNVKNGELRKKIDAIRWDLKKLDEMVFNLKLGEKI